MWKAVLEHQLCHLSPGPFCQHPARQEEQASCTQLTQDRGESWALEVLPGWPWTNHSNSEFLCAPFDNSGSGNLPLEAALKMKGWLYYTKSLARCGPSK